MEISDSLLQNRQVEERGNSSRRRYKALEEPFAETPEIVYDGGMSEHVSPLDLDAIERDLADVDAALTRLDNDTYWVDEVTGQPLSADLLAAQPTARRNNP